MRCGAHAAVMLEVVGWAGSNLRSMLLGVRPIRFGDFDGGKPSRSMMEAHSTRHPRTTPGGTRGVDSTVASGGTRGIASLQRLHRQTAMLPRRDHQRYR